MRHCKPYFKMAAELNIDQKDEILKIAENAIESITRLTNIVGRAKSNSSSAVEELQRRFPAAGAASRGRNTTSTNMTTTLVCSRRPAPYSRRTAGRPHESATVSKDVVVIEYGHDKVPSKADKIELEKSKRIISGFEIGRDWTSIQLEKELSALLKGTEMERFSFEIMKNCSGTLVKPNIPVGRKIDSKLLLKSIAPTGCVYIRLLADLPSDDDDDDDMLSYSVFDRPKTQAISSLVSTSTSSTSTSVVPPSSTNTSPPITTLSSLRSSVNATQSPSTTSSTMTNSTVDFTGEQERVANDTKKQPDAKPVYTATSNYKGHTIQCPFDINSIVRLAQSQNLTDPVETLRFLQENIIIGRKLDVVSCDESCEGETNFINVDRDRPLETTFSELEFVHDYRVTFRIGFMGEEVVDLGGPRREWIRLVNREMKRKYFDQGLRQYCSQDYFFVGIMIAVAMLQNGQMPAFIEEEILNEILSTSQSLNPCIREVKAGLEQLGMLSALQELRMLHHLLRPNSQHQLTVPKLLSLLKPKFSEKGSNSLSHEKEVYHLFIRYLREVASGERTCGDLKLQLSNILEFVTGSAEEPVLGFTLTPSIEFVHPPLEKLMVTDSSDENGQSAMLMKEVKAGFTPTAHTCGNILNLPMPTNHIPLPTQQRLFDIYDLAFSQSYFGKM